MSKKKKYNHKKQTKQKYIVKVSKAEKAARAFIAVFLLGAMIIPLAASSIPGGSVSAGQSAINGDLSDTGITEDQLKMLFGATPSDAQPNANGANGFMLSPQMIQSEPPIVDTEE